MWHRSSTIVPAMRSRGSGHRVSARPPRRTRRRLSRTRPAEQEALAELIGASPAIQQVRERILSIVRSEGPRSNVLLEGEAGTGKSLVAGLLLRLGRPQAGVVTVDCAAMPESLLGDVLFGVPSDGSRARPWLTPGLLELVTGGAIVLEEVCHLPKKFQAMLVRALGPPSPGDRRARAERPWVISTCNINMDGALLNDYFREDLFRQLAGVRIKMPPLRECGDDALIIANRLLLRICTEHQRPPITLAPEVGQRFLEYVWPGSVRELTNVLARAALLSTGRVISARVLERVTGAFGDNRAREF
jgi:DNA-binding NtrC family response regulator